MMHPFIIFAELIFFSMSLFATSFADVMASIVEPIGQVLCIRKIGAISEADCKADSQVGALPSGIG